MLLRSLRVALPLLALVAVAVFLLQRARPETTAQTALVVPQTTPAIRIDEYGLDVTSLGAVNAAIERGATLSSILTPYGFSMEEVGAIVENARPVFDVRKMQIGRPYRIYTEAGKARYLVYEASRIEYVVFDLANSGAATRFERPMETHRRTVSTTISNSLYASLEEAGADAGLAARLAEVYAWQIDFYRLQKGDEFSVTFEEQTVDGESVGVGEVLAARFQHAGRPYYAFHFEQEGDAEYYDENGESLRKAFLKAPLKFSRISSRFSLNRFHPVQKRYKAHLGTDYAAPTGTPIQATGDGVVLEAGYRSNNGNYVKIRHNGTYMTGYLHMSRIGAGIRPGARVRQGDVIGYVGSTGLATGPHVCYRFWKDGSQVDPLQEAFPSATPIADDQRAAFEGQRDRLMASLGASGEAANLADAQVR